MNFKRLWWIATTSTLLMLAPHAWAENDFHVGASIGGASISDDRFFIRDSSRVYKLYGAYQFNDYFVAEAAFIDFDDVTEAIVINTASQRAVADGYGFGVVGMAQFPVGRFALTAKGPVKGSLFLFQLPEDANLCSPQGGVRTEADDVGRQTEPRSGDEAA